MSISETDQVLICRISIIEYKVDFVGNEYGKEAIRCTIPEEPMRLPCDVTLTLSSTSYCFGVSMASNLQNGSGRFSSLCALHRFRDLKRRPPSTPGGTVALYVLRGQTFRPFG